MTGKHVIPWATLAVLWPVLWSDGATATVPEIERLAFTIHRNGDKIGDRVVDIRRTGDRVVVETTLEIAIKIAFVTVYRRSGLKREVWKNGVLIEYRGELNDDGEQSRVHARANGTKLITERPGGRTISALGTMVATYWNPATVEQKRLLHAVTGRIVPVSVARLGEEQVKTATGRVPARRYRMNGKLARDLWYDRRGNLVAMRHKARDGSIIDYRRK